MVVGVRTRVSQVTPESPGTPHAMVYGLYVLSPAIRPWVVTVIGSVLTADLTPALRRQDHTLSLVRLGAVRPTVPPRPPLPRPASVTLRDAPLSGTGCKSYSAICTSEKQKYFYHRGLTRHNQNTSDLPDGWSHSSAGFPLFLWERGKSLTRCYPGAIRAWSMPATAVSSPRPAFASSSGCGGWSSSSCRRRQPRIRRASGSARSQPDRRRGS